MGHQIEILVLEDDEDICYLYSEAIEELDIIVHKASSVDEAIKLFTRHKNIFFALIDYYTPGFKTAFEGGHGLLAKAFQSREHFDFYFVTGSADLTIDEAKSIGAKSILRKPFLIDELQNLVEAEVKGKQELIFPKAI